MKQISLRIDREQKAVRLDQFLASKLPNMSRTQAQKLIAAGMVCENGKPVKQSSHKTVPEALLEITIPYREEVKLVAQDIPLDILYEDDDLLVINKPAGLVV
ncbi:MAG TPA: S4 domain-containing protein, partial [bacterium]|nr:S4 domain-containing protein [bacterium]